MGGKVRHVLGCSRRSIVRFLVGLSLRAATDLSATGVRPMSGIEWVAITAFVVGSGFPVAYSFLLKLENKLLFVFSSYGAETVIGVLLVGAATPLIILSVYMFPQLSAFNSAYSWLSVPGKWIAEYWWFLSPVILLIVPRYIHRRYRAFFEHAAAR